MLVQHIDRRGDAIAALKKGGDLSGGSPNVHGLLLLARALQVLDYSLLIPLPSLKKKFVSYFGTAGVTELVRIGGNSSGGFQDGWEGQGGNERKVPKRVAGVGVGIPLQTGK